MKKNICLLFGGKSCEHDISIITGVQLAKNLKSKNIEKIYISLENKFFFFNAGRQGKINELLNKQVQCRLAEECGLAIPRQEVVDTGVLPKTLKYPVLTKTLKSTMGRWKEDYYICEDEEQLLTAYQSIQSPKTLHRLI